MTDPARPVGDDPVSTGPQRPGIAAFDFDGTLIRGDSFLPFLARMAGRGRFVRVAIASSPAVARAYRVGGRDGLKEALVGSFLRGVPRERVEAVGEAYGADLAGRIQPKMAERVAWHRSEGHRLVLVSASLECYLATVGSALGFDAVLATQLVVAADGRLTGRLLGPNVRGAAKCDRLRAWLSQAVGDSAYELWAYGDSAGDGDLLAMADHPIRV